MQPPNGFKPSTHKQVLNRLSTFCVVLWYLMRECGFCILTCSLLNFVDGAFDAGSLDVFLRGRVRLGKMEGIQGSPCRLGDGTSLRRVLRRLHDALEGGHLRFHGVHLAGCVGQPLFSGNLPSFCLVHHLVGLLHNNKQQRLRHKI